MKVYILSLMVCITLVTMTYIVMGHYNRNPLDSARITIRPNYICDENGCHLKNLGPDQWFDPYWCHEECQDMNSIINAQPRWQLYRYGRLYSERDLMGRNL
jgi:hypothetical protein